MLVDAVILAGGQSSRLGSVAKASLQVGGQSLVERAINAALGVARHCVVVGPFGPSAFTSPAFASAVFTTREDPPFSGPVAAVAAGVRRLALESSGGRGAGESAGESDSILLLACDMPGIAAQVPLLIAALTSASAEADGALSVDAANHIQPLAGLFRRRSLVDAISRFTEQDLVGLSMMKLIEPLSLLEVSTPPGATDDVDTWDDAVRLGAQSPTTASTSTTMNTNTRSSL